LVDLPSTDSHVVTLQNNPRPWVLTVSGHPEVPGSSRSGVSVQEVGQDVGQDPQLLATGHHASTPVHPQSTDIAGYDELAVLPLGSVIRMHPHGVLVTHPLDDLGVLDADTRSEDLANVGEPVPNERQRLGDRRAETLVKQE
jgi:hypothetical protein